MESLFAYKNRLTELVESFKPNPNEGDGFKSAWYADWDDNYIGRIINNPITMACLRQIADKFYGSQLDAFLRQSTELTIDTMPSLFAVYERCCKILSIYKKPKAYVTGRLSGINALSVEIKKQRLVFISRKAAFFLTPNEQAFLLGHELGHHQQGNLVCHTVNGLVGSLERFSNMFGKIIPDSIEIPLKQWCRRSEFNADRAGYLCCKDLNSINSIFAKAIPNKRYSASDMYKELCCDHPLLVARINELSKYIKTLEE